MLDWTSQSSFLKDLIELLASIPISTSSDTLFMPQGYDSPSEARLETFGPSWRPKIDTWSDLNKWWLCHRVGANTPNWDIAVGCLIENSPGLVLVEAKANWKELGTAGKKLSSSSSAKSRDNYDCIGKAIQEACDGWRLLDERVAISYKSHYQLANRLAFTWKLGMLGFPVVLMYLGFIGDYGIRDVGEPFSDDEDWQQALMQYTENIIPMDMFDRRLDIGPSPVWLLSRSRSIIEVSPKAVS
ncbi:MAG: hypothetical protein KAU38_06255 [Desulfobacterales bacterium]|nr:hypothetical protein [Desulfobacterales bacterium]